MNKVLAIKPHFYDVTGIQTGWRPLVYVYLS